jgi:polyisoprenoid-binding protein YceI
MSTGTSTVPNETTAGLTTWRIDAAHSHVEFAVKHMMISTVRGRFTDVTGTVQSADDDPAAGLADISIAAASIDTREPQRDAHLRSADFLDVEKFPAITFKSTRIDGITRDGFRLTGNLTIHGVTREAVLDVTAEGRGKDPWGGERAGYSATTKIKRSDYGLLWNQALETGGLLVGDEVKINIDLELIKAA